MRTLPVLDLIEGMRKLLATLLVTFLFLAIGLSVSVKNINAQCGTYQFFCRWTNEDDGCLVDVHMSCNLCNYDPGGPNQSYCQQFTTPETCDGQGSLCLDVFTPTPTAGPTPTPPPGATATPIPPTLCWNCENNLGDWLCVGPYPPNNDGTCNGFEGQGSCINNCPPPGGFDSFNCIEDQQKCTPTINGEYTGDTAYDDCLSACGNSGPQKIFCDNNGNPTDDSSTGKIYTAIGCIPVKAQQEFANFFLRWGIGVGSGSAFLLMGYAFILIMTSSGNPERLKAGKELLGAAIVGLSLLIFSAFILRIVGVEILRIPGLQA